MMKKILYMTVAAVLMLTGCGKEEAQKTPKDMICGQWHSTALAIDADIYAGFNSDGTFELYQQIGEGSHRLYEGTWSFEGSILSGKYNDGASWSASYEVVFGDNIMTWTSKNDAAETSIYERIAEIPSEVKDNCITDVN